MTGQVLSVSGGLTMARGQLLITKPGELRNYQDILYEVEEAPSAIITINRPERLNAFRGRTIGELLHAFKRAWADQRCRLRDLHRRGRPGLLLRRRPEGVRRARELRDERERPVGSSRICSR